ncbi:MAG TPA: pyruvate kinase [Gammaproteobacteria bacterium]|nr:pyruvate kinase [Gammaproteobacteria bacterium]
MALRRTKIVVTLGPASDDPAVMRRLIQAGMDVARINYSHETRESHEALFQLVREQSAKLNTEIGIIADLQGPKIRIQRFREGPIWLEAGDEFIIDPKWDAGAGDEHHVGVTYTDLPRDVKAGDTLMIDDGRVVLKVEQVKGTAVHCVVMLGGQLSNNKGLNREGGGLSAASLTPKDRQDLKHAVAQGADYIAVSFPRTGADIHAARKLVEKAGGKCGIIAKIERAEAIEHIDDIIVAADGIMVARGDLGVEIGDAHLAPMQKRLIRLARGKKRLVIIATQMMESMVENMIPTRAEVFDVANAVLDGTDAVMLSAETSVGKYPDAAVEAMSRICLGTEEQWREQDAHVQLDVHFDRIDEAIAISAMYAANRIDARAIAALTETGNTCITMSRIHSAIPIFAFTQHEATQRKVRLFRGVYPVKFDVTHTDSLEINRELVDLLLQRKVVQEGDRIIITKGDIRGSTGGTNLLKIVRIGDVIGRYQ